MEEQNIRELNGKKRNLDINKILKEKKKNEIIDIYVGETGIPRNILENIWNFCEKMPEKTIKQIKKGQYKNKNNKFKPNRPHFKDGTILNTVTVRELTQEEIDNYKKPNEKLVTILENQTNENQTIIDNLRIEEIE